MNNNNIKSSSSWLEWFVGFSDAEGSFQTYPKKRTNSEGVVTHYGVGYSFTISLHSRDKMLLDETKLKLNDVGVLYNHNDGTEVRIAVNDREGLLWLVENVFDKYPLLTAHQVRRYNLLKYGLLNNIKRFDNLEEYNKFALTDYTQENKANVVEQFSPPRPASFTPPANSYLGLGGMFLNVDNWIIGFINGEGCFYHKNNKPVFCIEHTDKHGLELIKKRLGFGPNIIARSPRARDIDNPKKRGVVGTPSYLKTLYLLGFLSHCASLDLLPVGIYRLSLFYINFDNE